jgi:adenosylcobinamide-GDP ribazoletransferase
MRLGPDDFFCFTERIYIFIVVGVLAGAILGVSGYLLQVFLPGAIVPVLVIACIYLLTGINHLDGLSDMGDGVIANGPREKKVAAMKDVHAGAGGVLFIGMNLLLLYSAISLFTGMGLILLFPLFVAEICAKVAITTVASFGRSAHEGMGSLVINGAKNEHYVLGLLLAIASAFLAMAFWVLSTSSYDGLTVYGLFLILQQAFTMGILGLLAVISAVLVGLAFIHIGNRHFGGVSGDVMGAANESARIAALFLMGVLLWMRL